MNLMSTYKSYDQRDILITLNNEDLEEIKESGLDKDFKIDIPLKLEFNEQVVFHNFMVNIIVRKGR